MEKKNKEINCVPLFNKLIVTAEKVNTNVTENGIYLPYSYSKGSVKERQKVLKIGTTVRDIEEGDEVLINFSRYMELKHQPGSIQDDVQKDNPVVKIHYPFFELDNGEKVLLIDDRDVVVKYPKKKND